jgi:hypothetical protein
LTSPARHSSLGSVLQFEQLISRQTLESDLVCLLEQRVAVRSLPRDQEVVNLFGSGGTLQFLALEQVPLDGLPGSTGSDKVLGTLCVSSTSAGGDQVCHTGALLGKGGSLRSREKFGGELGHFLQTDSDDGGLGVASQLHAVDETGSQCDDVLERTSKRDTADVFDRVNLELLRVEDRVPQQRVVMCRATDGGLTELLSGDFKRDVGAGQG